jgi:hypothetical protein
MSPHFKRYSLVGFHCYRCCLLQQPLVDTLPVTEIGGMRPPSGSSGYHNPLPNSWNGTNLKKSLRMGRYSGKRDGKALDPPLVKRQQKSQLTSEGTSGPQTRLRCRPVARDSSSAPSRHAWGGSTSPPSCRTRGGSTAEPSTTHGVGQPRRLPTAHGVGQPRAIAHPAL